MGERAGVRKRSIHSKVGDETVLHELCRLWNHTVLMANAREPNLDPSVGRPRFQSSRKPILELPTTLITRGANVQGMTGNGQTPLDLLLSDAGQVLVLPRHAGCLHAG